MDATSSLSGIATRAESRVGSRTKWTASTEARVDRSTKVGRARWGQTSLPGPGAGHRQSVPEIPDGCADGRGGAV